MIVLEPVGFVRSPRREIRDDDWGSVVSTIELTAGFDESALDGIEDFSHVEVVFQFHLLDESRVARGARHPRGNASWPRVGVFAQRTKFRPNRLGSTIVELVSREGRRLTVRGLDALDGTPVLDIKPVMAEFLPRTPVKQPAWSHALMRNYWRMA